MLIAHTDLRRLPLNFNKVTGDFNCQQNKLTTLKGAPVEVGGSFGCSSNNLKSLKHSPKLVVRDFGCSYNKLSNLIGSPEIVHSFYCRENKILTTLEGCPRECIQDFTASQCYSLVDLKNGPEIVGGDFDFEGSYINTLEYHPRKIEGMAYFDAQYFPEQFQYYFNKLSNIQVKIMMKYISNYDVWTNGVYHNENMILLYEDIIDGLE